jgi:FHA domain-containing protein
MSATETDAAKDPLEDVSRIAEALEAAGEAVHAYRESSEAKQALSEQLEAAVLESKTTREVAQAAIEAGLATSKAPLKAARRALRELQGGAEEQALDKLKKEVDSRRAALEGLREKLEPLALAAGSAEANLADGKKMLEEGETELETAKADLAKLEASEAEAQGAYETARKEADALSEKARSARETTKLASAKLIAAEASVESHQRKIEAAKSAQDEAKSAFAELEEAAQAARDEASASEEQLGSAKAELDAARQAQLESSQALARVETPDEEEEAEAAASEALGLVAKARSARNEAKAALEAKQAEIEAAEAKVKEGQAALAEAEAAVAEAEEAAAKAEAKLEEQKAAAGTDAAQSAGAAAHSAAEMADLSEATLKAVRAQLEAAQGKVSELEEDLATLRQANKGNQAFVAAQFEELARAKADVEAARRALEESEAGLKDSQAEFSSSRSELQQLLTALARVEKEREEYELLLEELKDEAGAEVAESEDEADFADTGAWGNLDSLFDEPAMPPANRVERSSLSETEITELPPPAEEAPAPGAPSFRLSVSLPGRHLADYEFSQEEVTVGRESDCDVVLDSPVVSRNQFSIRQHDGLFALIDAGTSNGTFINGKRVAGLTLLNDGDGIGIGKYRLRFIAETHAAFDLAERLEKAGGVELGGMTLRITPEESRRQAGEHDRVRGYLVLPNPSGNDPIRHALGEVFSVGKDIACDLVLRGWFAPKRAAIITRGYDRFSLINVAPSGRDVSVNGEVVRDHRRLANGDRIEIYGHRFLFQLPQE